MIGGWTDEDDVLLRKLAGEGLTATQMRKAFPGRSRCAIIGRCFRKGIGVGGAAAPQVKAKSARTIQRRAAARAADLAVGGGHHHATRSYGLAAESADRGALKRAEASASPHAIASAAAIAAMGPGVVLFDARRDQCKFIPGDPLVEAVACGAPATRGSYCAAHAALCYATEKKPAVRVPRDASGRAPRNRGDALFDRICAGRG